MFRIVEKDILNPTITRLVIEAPFVAKKAQPGQFIILRTYADSERIPFTVAGTDPEKGTVTIIYQIVGASTLELNQIKVGESLADFVGPLGKPSELEGLKHVAIVGGGAGCAIAYPLAYKLHQLGADVCSVAGFRNKDLVILEKEFEELGIKPLIYTVDGSYGEKGFPTQSLKEPHSYLYSCGPEPLLKALAEDQGKGEFSLERRMGCGYGCCMGCTIVTKNGPRRVCKEGPVFEKEDLVW